MAYELFVRPKVPEIFVGRAAALDQLVSEVRGGARGFPDMPVVGAEGTIHSFPRLGGLHHRCEVAA